MAVTPNTDVYLLKCPLELDEANQINFASATAQFNYFYSLPKLEAENFTYQRKDSIIRFPAHIDTLLEYTYVMYRNTAYGNKWFYAYITDMQYINDNMTAITIKTDSWQTWGFDVTLKKSFVEREHVADDTFGIHTVPEGLDTGEYVCNGIPDRIIYAKANDEDLAPVVMFQVTKATLKASGKPDYTFPSARLGVHNGIPQGCLCFGLRLTENTVGTVHSVCGIYDSYGAGDAIISISLVPYLRGAWIIKQDSSNNDFLVPIDTWMDDIYATATITRNTTLDGYTPKNNKMFTGEFNYVYASNNAGADITYHWENFNDGDLTYAVYSAIDQGGSMKFVPINSIVSSGAEYYKDGWNEGLMGTKLPCISWVSDYYLNWKAVNGTNVAVQTALGGLGTVASALISPTSLASASVDYASSVASTMQAIKQAEMTPPQAKGNTSAGDLIFSHGTAGFSIRKMSVRAEYARRIDDFLSAFGYRVNTFKQPQFTSRASWNYIKTKGIAIEGRIPQANLQEIKDIFNNGVTMWHNPATFLDYSQSNNIV